MSLDSYPFIHAFHLDINSLNVYVSDAPQNLPQLRAWEKIRGVLTEKGYGVYASTRSAYNLPIDILLVKELLDKVPDFKGDLASVAQKVHAPYQSGSFYIGHK